MCYLSGSFATKAYIHIIMSSLSIIYIETVNNNNSTNLNINNSSCCIKLQF